MTVDDLRQRLTVSIAEAAQALTISRDQAYKLARSGELPVLRIRKRMTVPVASLLRLVDEAANKPTAT